ncbi:hypothetical protein SAMN05216228_104634 [Rhizobium tibeticum]|uniref:Uncharacterized protein n=1 Tax=Rhizobium tibeticum TaxID=501024 RepID=A0A1H8VS27_9HYPH|nr:hypothetical protein [Rhizobium tibeticum]SEI19408.1 hypothetical protein RTCCBAU85039_6148 [Rhizobium tibeticum]SEP18114.1 hypothetical protein SAMN05216228_104634 [Rhizobium tibeticum]
MSLFNLLTDLEDQDIDTVTTVVRSWCEKHNVSVESECGGAAMTAAVNRVIAGEKTPESLYEAISIQMHVGRHKNPFA